ncbi:Arylsulfatase A [Pseudomonas citronellolis]|uniref:Arylsulfatase A n=1 Tax=Pseudomonas citronellolis TaxID=53408 RepID=A0AAQ1HR19_9PSED|nr:sulfatase-like hydrolase/transferase [Pseudomonas citronellolis]TGC23119.1 hypothetical protein CW310_25730 [Pseudomonas citronellolis]SFC16280.1 Arylsulfatase A [Pseudomonas citronellolis]
MNYWKRILHGLFVALYFMPLLLEPGSLSISEPQIRSLLDRALVTPAIVWGAIYFVFVNVLLCFLWLALLRWMASALGRAFEASGLLLEACVLLFGWGLLVAVNAWLFPLSSYSVPFSVLSSPLLGKILAVVSVIGFCIVLFRRAGAARLKVYGLIASLLILLFGIGSIGSSATKAPETGRNIIILGVDSLSARVFEQNLLLLPNLAEATRHAQYYTKAYTPLGRTFPAWVTLLSGRLPAENGAFFNLRNMDHVSRAGLLPSVLRGLGYRTVFGIDERRFSNIDESFGFDEVVGPRPGVLDFLLQSASDTPLSNLLLQTRLGGFLLPYSYINTAAFANYSADGFVDAVAAAAEPDKPLFLAVHFESAHFPFKTRHARMKVQGSNPILVKHLEALTAVDAQVGRLMEQLRRKGVLDNALVVVVSDHGEGLGELEATIELDGHPVPVQGYGHGVNLLSEWQNRIVLAATQFVGGEPLDAAGSRNQQVSLLDLKRAIEGYAAGDDFNIVARDPCVIVETGIRLEAAADYRTLSEGTVVQQAASFYEIDSQGRMRLREDALPALLVAKDIGLRCADRLTWYEPVKKRYLSYGLDDQGRPYEQRTPRDEDISKIATYRLKYVH